MQRRAINLSIFVKFLFSSQRNTMSEGSKKILLLRHGKSKLNCDCDFHRKGAKIDWSKPIYDDEYCQKGPYNICEMDSSLADEGIEECKKMAEQMKEHSFDMVLVSPMLRALQTCQLIFGGKNIPIKVQPLLSEAYRYSCDLVPPGKTQQKHEMFKQFDFSQDYEPNYFYHFSSDKLNFVQKHFGWNDINLEYSRQKELIKLIRYHLLAENDHELKIRAQKLRQKVAKIIEENSLKNICLISHCHMLNCLRDHRQSAQKAELGPIPPKCHSIEMKLEEFMAI